MPNQSSGLEQKKPNDMLIGDTDNTGEIVKRIYYKSPSYVVYRTDTAIRIDLDDDGEDIESYKSNASKIAVDLARIYSWMPEQLSWSEPINRQIARSLSENAKGNDEAAKQMLEHAEARIKQLKTISGRLQYSISGYVVALSVFVVLLYLRWLGYDEASSGHVYYQFSTIAFCGALGGIISVSLGFPKIAIDIDANLLTNCLVGGSRIVISIAAAIFSYFAVTSGVAFSFLRSESGPNGIYVVAMIAGFSEMLVPNIMSNFAGNANKSDGESYEIGQQPKTESP